MRCLPFSLQGTLCLAMLIFVFGCTPEEEQVAPPPPVTNRNVVTPSGHAIGHLKPDPNLPEATHDPVVYVVDAGRVERRTDRVLVHAFRLDFDETKGLTEADLPYALMTENSREIVIHRDVPPDVLTHADINDGERCLPVYQCEDFENCPRCKEHNHYALFPHDGSEETPECPFCKGRTTSRYVVPQHRDMKKFIDRMKKL